MGIGVQGRGDRGVTQPFLDDLRGDIFLQQGAGVCMSKAFHRYSLKSYRLARPNHSIKKMFVLQLLDETIRQLFVSYRTRRPVARQDKRLVI